jgi:16S rRNA processing protein RimM
LSTEPSSGSKASAQPDALREVGRIGRAHGVRGDLYVDLVTDRAERLAVGARLFAGQRWLVVANSKRQPQRWIVHFQGFDDRTAAEQLTGSLLFADPLPVVDDDDALWVHDLIGSRVVEIDGTERGHCTSVLANPAHDILELDSGWLVPVTFVVEHRDGVTVIDPPDGLFDLG